MPRVFLELVFLHHSLRDYPPHVLFPRCSVSTCCGTEIASSHVRLFPVRSVDEYRASAWSSCPRSPLLRHVFYLLRLFTDRVIHSSDSRHTSCRSRFAFFLGFTAFTRVFRVSIHASHLKNEFVYGSSNLTVFVSSATRLCFQLHDQNAILSWSSEASDLCSCFSMSESCGPNTTVLPSSTVALTEANRL